jgi:SH3-like domain-containing protein
VKRLALFLSAVLPFAAGAGDWRVAETTAVLYDAPSLEAKPLYVVSRDYPLELVVDLENWVKVRDHTGAVSWVEKSLLAEKRTVLITMERAEARVRPEDDAPVAFFAAQNVVLELIEAAPEGWLHVRHADGETGYLRAAQAWGN